MSISISSGKVLQNLYSNNNGKTSYYTSIQNQKKVKVNEEVEKSISINSDFKKALRGLRSCDYSSGLKSDILKYTNKLIKSYNEFVENEGNGTKRYERKLKELTSVMEDYSSQLSEAGIIMADGGKLKLDAEKFDSASVSDLKAIFSPDSEFTELVGNKLSALNRMVKNDTHYTVTEDNYIFNQINSNNISIADNTNKLAISVDKLLNTPLLEDGSNEKEILTMLDQYVKQINDFYSGINDKAEYSQKAVDDINSIITLNSELNEAMDKDPFPYEELFNKEDSSSYASRILPLYQNLFGELVNASARDFTISSFVDYQV